MSQYVPLSFGWVTHVIRRPVTPGDTSMLSRNGQPSRPADRTGSDALRVQSHDGEPASENPPQPPSTDGADLAADDIQVVLPVSAGPGQLPPDRPRPPERPGPAPPVPAELPKRRQDASRPAVPHKRSAPPTRASPPGPPKPEPPGPSGRPLPPELFRPLWWQERSSPAGPARPPEPSGPPRASEPSWGTVLATTVRLWLRCRLAWTRRLWPARAGWRTVVVVALVAAVFVAGAATIILSGSGRGRQGGGS